MPPSERSRDRNQNTGVAEHPEVLGHVGLLVNHSNAFLTALPIGIVQLAVVTPELLGRLGGLLGRLFSRHAASGRGSGLALRFDRVPNSSRDITHQKRHKCFFVSWQQWEGELVSHPFGQSLVSAHS